MMKLIVGQFNDSYPPVMDGVGNAVQNYAYWINKKYGKSYVITPKFPRYIDDEEFEVIRYASTHLPLRPPYRLGLPLVAFHSKKKLKQIDFNILHVHSPFSSGQLALKLAIKKQIPIIATFHSKFYDDFKQILKNDFLAKMVVKRIIAFYNKVDYVWTVNERTAHTLKKYGYKNNIEIIPNGTDFDSNFNFLKNNSYMKQHYQIEEDELVFLFVGQHIWQKNIKLIVEALSLLKQRNLSFKMLFIGEGYAKKDLKILTNKLNIKNHVKFLGKVTDRTTLKRFYARSNLFVFPSVYDNAPIVVREAAVLKTPSIVIENSNAQEGIIDGINGFTCKENALSLANKIEQIADINYLQTIGEKAKETLALSWETVVDQVGNRYKEIIMDYHDNLKTKIYVNQ